MGKGKEIFLGIGSAIAAGTMLFSIDKALAESPTPTPILTPAPELITQAPTCAPEDKIEKSFFININGKDINCLSEILPDENESRTPIDTYNPVRDCNQELRLAEGSETPGNTRIPGEPRAKCIYTMKIETVDLQLETPNDKQKKQYPDYLLYGIAGASLAGAGGIAFLSSRLKRNRPEE
ncbi:MAG: hypothetical protein AAB521_04205 [Patescibacteria group bacterium]